MSKVFLPLVAHLSSGLPGNRELCKELRTDQNVYLSAFGIHGKISSFSSGLLDSGEI